ncbi:MAG: class I SAM-dependent methyltransferase [Pseudonocardiaceae bacterium]
MGLLFIDGLHDYRSVRGDYDHFAPWVPLGGYVAFHDYSANFPDVVICVEEIRQQGCFAVCEVEGDLIVLRRRTAGAWA